MNIRKMVAQKRGFTLVELMIVVVIIGILASLAIYGVQKYVKNSKTAEARSTLGAISKSAVTAYQGETMVGSLLPVGGTVGSARRLCQTTSNTVPAAATSIKGMKYQSGEAEWSTGTSDTGWTCLRFSLNGPQYFLYGYTATSSNPAVDGDEYLAYANGDLDADGTLSSFSLQGKLVSGTLTVSPAISEANPEE